MATYDELTGKYDFWSDRLEELQGMKLTKKRAAKIARIENRVENLESRIAEFPDQFTIGLTPALSPEGFARVSVGITDVPSDDSYTGGDPLLLEIRGKRSLGNGKTRRKVQRSSFVNGDYWNGDVSQIVSGGGYILKDFADFDKIKISIATDSGEGISGWNKQDVLASQTFDITEVF